MTRLYLPQALSHNSEIALPETAFRHLIQVLRMQVGESFIVFNGEGGEFSATLTQVAKKTAVARVGAFDAVDRESPRPLHLAQCVSKGERMEYTLQKAVELGVTDIQPLLSSRSVVRMDSERWEKKLEHWRGIVVSACEQSGRTRVPQLQPVQALPAWLEAGGGAGERLTLDPTATNSLRGLAAPPEAVTLLVGPEGGLSEAELELARRAGYTGIRMGPRILRTETAGVAALSAIQALWGDWA